MRTLVVLCIMLVGCATQAIDISPSDRAAGSPAFDATTGTRTVIVPVVPVTTDAPRVALYASIGGIGSGSRNLYVPLPTTAGDTIVGFRVRMQDDGAGTLAHGILMRSSDGSEGFTQLYATNMSCGCGVEQTLSASGTAIVATAGQEYWVTVGVGSGTASSSAAVYRLELDLQ